MNTPTENDESLLCALEWKCICSADREKLIADYRAQCVAEATAELTKEINEQARLLSMSAERELALRAAGNRIAKAMKPFAEFVFGKLSVYSGKEPSTIVLCGYTDEGVRNGIDITLGDIDDAKQALAEWEARIK